MTLIHDRVEAARNGQNPMVICRLLSGWLVMGDWQFLPGYSLLLPDPVVPSLNDLTGLQREQFLIDMACIGDALLEVTDAVRINYEILGNSEPALHAHICPRYAWEPEEMRTRQVNRYDRKAGPPFDAARDRPLMDHIAAALTRALTREKHRT